MFEYIGGDLLDVILTHDWLSELMTQHITYQMCSSLSVRPHPALDTMGSSDSEIACLQYIHSQGITPRDLEPEVCRLGWMFSRDSSDTELIPQNVLLTKDDPPVVKVAAFGLACG